MTHLTMTGYYAGLPLCGIDSPFDKAAAKERGETFVHAIYAPTAVFAPDSDLCAKCRSEWDAADEDDDGRGDPNDCAECARSFGPWYRGDCEHV